MSVTPEVVAVALGVTAPNPADAKYMQWTMWIADAEMLITLRATQLDINVDTIDEAKIDYVVREAVVAQVKRPDDATQVTASIDDGSVSKTYRSSRGRVTILDEWWGLLGLTAPAGAFALDLVPRGSNHLPWCSLYFGATYCSCGTDIAGHPIYELGEEW